TRELRAFGRYRVIGIIEHNHLTQIGQKLFENLQPFTGKVARQVLDTRQSASGLGEVLNISESNRVAAHRKNNWRVLRRFNDHIGNWRRVSENELDLILLKFFRNACRGFGVTL